MQNALENQSMIGDEEGAPERNIGASIKHTAKLSQTNYDELRNLIEQGRQHDAIEFLKTYLPNNLFTFSWNDYNIF